MQSPISHNTSFLSFVPSWLKTLLCASAPRREIRLFRVIAILLSFASITFAANWDRFRGPNGAGQSDDAGIPTKWELANFLWKRPLSNVGHSSPVIWDKQLFLTSGDPKTGAQIVNAFEAQTGAPLWEKRFEAGSYH